MNERAATHKIASAPPHETALALVVALAAAIPSLLWLWSGPALLADDLTLRVLFEERGLLEGAWSVSFEAPRRPLLGPYHLVTHGLLGSHPWVNALILAALNALTALALWAVLRRVVPARVALLTAGAFALVPNRATTRFWFATGNYLLATLLVLIGAHFLLTAGSSQRRFAVAAGLFGSAVLLFEGSVGLIGAALFLWTIRDPGSRARTAVMVGVPAALSALAVLLISPKGRGEDSPTPIDSLETLGEGLLGQGLWGPLGALGAIALLTLVALGLVAMAPSFERLREVTQPFRIGAVIAGCGLTPFVVGGSPFAVRGIFDRTNQVPSIGVCVLIAGGLAWLLRNHTGAGGALMMLVAVIFVGGTYRDLRDYRDSVTEGDQIIAAVIAAEPPRAQTVIVGPLLIDDRGVAAFVSSVDLDRAVDLHASADHRRPTWLAPQTVGRCTEELQLRSREAVEAYDWILREYTDDPVQVCRPLHDGR